MAVCPVACTSDPARLHATHQGLAGMSVNCQLGDYDRVGIEETWHVWRISIEHLIYKIFGILLTTVGSPDHANLLSLSFGCCSPLVYKKTVHCYWLATVWDSLFPNWLSCIFRPKERNKEDVDPQYKLEIPILPRVHPVPVVLKILRRHDLPRPNANKRWFDSFILCSLLLKEIPILRHGCLCWCLSSLMMMIAFLTFNSSLVPLSEGLSSSNPWNFEFLGFGQNRTDDLGIKSPSIWPNKPRLHVRFLNTHCQCYNLRIEPQYRYQ